MSKKPSSGGAATQAGTIFQNRVAAWYSVRVLAEKNASPLWGLSPNSTLEFIRCETEQPVDDIMVGTSEGGHAFIQVKHSVSGEVSSESALASALDQFARQYLAYKGSGNGSRPWERPLDSARDRLVLAVGPSTSNAVKQDLPKVLARLRSSPTLDAVSQAATTGKENAILAKVIDHVRNSWKATIGLEPDNEDIRNLLAYVYIQVVDVDDGGAGEREAKDLLRGAVLQSPDAAEAAWQCLITTCGEFAIRRGGGDRAALQRALLEAGIQPVSARGYREDIDRLRRYSHDTLEALSDLAEIRIGPEVVKIERQSTLALSTAAETRSVVVVGEPGAGKSGALHDFAASLDAAGRDYVYFAVDRLDAPSAGALRQELGLSHDLVEVLENWAGDKPAFLITDALDAARSDATAATLRNLLTKVVGRLPRWRVVASIRQFDLRYDQHLRKLFRGRPATPYRSSSFPDVSHIDVPLLSADEMDAAFAQSDALSSLFRRLLEDTGSRLIGLMSSPFNLRLVGELLGAGIEAESLSPIKTQIELLDSYWHHRVIRGDDRGDARESLLRAAADAMVRERSLRVDRAVVADDPGNSAVLKELLSSQLLAEWQPAPDAAPDRYVLTFGHHVLFDYAVSNLLLRGDPRRFVTRLEEDPELVIAIRPSISYFYQHEWFKEDSRSSFWTMVFLLVKSARLPEMGKLIGPSVAADLATSVEDFELLLKELRRNETEALQHAVQTLRYLTGALLAARESGGRPLVGPNAPPWCQFLEACSDPIDPIAYQIRRLLLKITDEPSKLTQEQLIAIGAVARRFLNFASRQIDADLSLLPQGIEAVCRTFESNAEESRAILRRSFELDNLQSVGFIAIPALAREVERLVVYDPDFVEEVYRTAFSYKEKSKETTAMVPSRIMGFLSHRSQDYDHALWVLTSCFSAFIKVAPVHATRAMISAVRAYIVRKHTHGDTETSVETFQFLGHESRYRSDYSEIWDIGSSRDDEPLKLLGQLMSYLSALSEDDSRQSTRIALLDVMAESNEAAVVWRRLLRRGAEYPSTLGLDIKSLAWTAPILYRSDTSRAAGDLVRAIFPLLDEEERARVEKAILSIQEYTAIRSPDSLNWTRDRLLGCIPVGLAVTEQARAVIDSFSEDDGPPSNEEPRSSIGSFSRPLTDEDILSRDGVPVDEPANREIQKLTNPVSEFASRFRSTTPGMNDIHAVLPAIHVLIASLDAGVESGVHEKQLELGWAYLIDACETIARAEQAAQDEELVNTVRRVLLAGAANPEPANPDSDFDRFPSWGCPAPRVDAAKGLMNLAAYISAPGDDVIAAIRKLADDPDPAVRLQIASSLTYLYHTNRELMWSLAEGFTQREASTAVLKFLVAGPLSDLAGPHPERVSDLAVTIFSRTFTGPGAAEVRSGCASIFLGIFLWQDNRLAGDMVAEIVAEPSRYSSEAHAFAFDLRNLLTVGGAESADRREDQVRRGAIDVMLRLLRATKEALVLADERSKETPVDAWPPAEQEDLKHLLHLADSIAKQVFFASGAFDHELPQEDRRKRPIGAAEKKRFLEEGIRLFEELADIGLAPVSHSLVKTLEHLMEYDPARVVGLIGKVVRAGRSGGYQYEPLAVDAIVNIVKRLLAEYRHLLTEDEECRRALVETLDTFVEAGWPSALQLAFRIEEIFR